MLELQRSVEREKAARERESKEYMKKIHQTVKNFFPSSWRDKPGLCHKDIDAWDLDEFKEKEDAWRQAYTLVRDFLPIKILENSSGPERDDGPSREEKGSISETRRAA